MSNLVPFVIEKTAAGERSYDKSVAVHPPL